MKPKSTLRSFLCIASSALLTISYSHALTYTWDPTNVAGTPAPTLDWFTAGANPLGLWTGVVVPTSASDTTIRFFPDTTTSLPNTNTTGVTQTVNLNNGGSAFQLAALELNGFGSATSGALLTMTLQGDALNFSGAAGTISFNSRKNTAPGTDPVINYTINNNIELGTAGSASALTLNGNGDGSSPSTTSYIIGGNISQLQVGGVGSSILKSGSSAVTISGTINITGAVQVDAGTLTLSNNTISTSAMTVNGGTLILTGNLTPASASMTVNSGGFLQIGNSTNTQFGPSGVYSGNISTGTGGTLLLRSNSSQELSGIISGSGGINKGRTGTLTLSGLNTYTGKSVFQPLSNGAYFQVNVSSFNYVTSGDWANHLVGSSLGKPTTVANGTIDVGGVAQAGATLNYTGGGETTDRVVAVAWNGNSTQTISASGGGLLNFTSAFTAASSGGTGSLVLTGAGNGEVNGITGSLNTDGLSKQGNGTWTISGPSNFTQKTIIAASGGILNLTSATALQNSPFDTASAAGTLTIGLRTTTSTLTLGGLTGANALRGRFTTALGGPLGATAQGGYDGLTNLTLNTVAGSNYTYSVGIVDGAAGMSLTKTGAGLHTLNGTHTYTGTTFVNGGFLSLNGNTLTGGLSVSNGTLLSNSSFGGLSSVTSSGVIAPGASLGAIGQLTINNASASALTLNGSTTIFDLPASVTTPDRIAVTGGGGLVLGTGTNTVLLQTPTTGVLPGTYDLMTFTGAPTGAGSLVFANGSTTMGNASLSVSAGLVQLTVGAGGLAGTTTFTGAGGTGNTNNWSTAARWDTGVVPTGAVNVTLAPSSGGGVTANDASVLTYSGNLTINPGVTLQLGYTTDFPAAYNALGTPGTSIIFLHAGSRILSRNGGSGTFSDIVLLGDANVTLGDSTESSMAATFRSITGPYTFNLVTQSSNGATANSTLSAANSVSTLNISGGTASGSVSADVAGSIGSANVSVSSFAKLILNHSSAITDNANPIRINNGILELGAGAGVTAPLTLSTRPIELNGSGGATISNVSATANILTLGGGISSTAAGAKTLTLEGGNAGLNTISGNITDGTGGGTVALTRANTGTWALGGTNTYSGNTNLAPGLNSRIVFQGSQSLSPNTKLIFAQNSGSVTNVRFLDDGTGTINFNRPIEFDSSAGGANTTLAIFVGNNNTANQGTSTGTTTGSTIQVGNITHTLSGSGTGGLSINATSPDGYRLQTGTITLNNLTGLTGAGGLVTTLNPTTANMTVAAITMATGNVTANDGVPVLRLSGSSSDNIVTGAISNATDFATGHVLSVEKQNSSTWILQGSNTYSGTTAITGGTLAGIGTNAFGNTTGISIAAASTATLSLRGDTDTEFKRASDSVRYALTTTANGATINVDHATIGDTGSQTMTIGTLALNNAVTNGTNFTGANNTSLSIGAVTTAAAASGTETLTNNIASTGTLTLASLAVNRTGTPTLVFNGTGNTTVGGAISGTLATALTYSGTGTLLLNGTNTYTGLTTVSAGTLGGTGTIPGAVTVQAAGSLAPGASPGTLSIGGVLNISAQANGGTGKLNFELGPNGLGTSDRIVLTGSGSLTIGGAFLGFSDFNFSALSGLTNGTYKLITSANAISGGLDPANLSGLIEGGPASGTLQITGNDVELVVSGAGAGSAYDTWKAANAPGSNPDQDTDGDGVSNAVEFVLGGTSLTKDLSKLPTLTTSGGNMIFNFKRAQNSIDPKTAVFIEVGTNLAIWNVPNSPYTVPDGAIAGPPVTVVKGVPAGFDTITLTVAQDSARKFARLKVVITP